MKKTPVKKNRLNFYQLTIPVLVIGLIIGIYFSLQKFSGLNFLTPTLSHHWKIRSIDTMKYSRDLAREKLHNETFDAIIDQQVANIASTGANYVGIATPYDEEFRPILKRWVKAARKYKLLVWFRGNFSGWEGWFDYPKIDRPTHIAKTKQFILDNKDLFVDDDIFTPCPECEQGPLVKLHDSQGIEAHRAFLIQERETAQDAFSEIGRRVDAGYYSMNGDVARAIMDKETTKALGGVVVIDHYVDTPEKLASDIKEFSLKSGGKVILGEFGAPIPDIHGNMTESEQSAWIREAFIKIAFLPELTGLNYWVNTGGTTALWNSDGSERKAVKTIRDFY